MSMTTEKKIKFIFKLDKMGLPLRMKQISSIKYVCVFNQIQLKLLYSEIFERDFNRDNHCFIQSTGFYCSYCCCLLYGNGWSLCIAFNVRQSIVNIGRTEKKEKNIIYKYTHRKSNFKWMVFLKHFKPIVIIVIFGFGLI